MTEHVIKYMQKQLYEGLTEKDNLKRDFAISWFNNCGVFIEDEDNILCRDCPLPECLKCNDRISKEDYLMDIAYNEQSCDNCKNYGKLEDNEYNCGEDEWCEYWEGEE